MSKRIISLNDSYRKNLKESVKVTSGRPKGEVGIFEKSKSGILTPINCKPNMIVFSGREWLLRRAFADSIAGNDPDLYNKTLKWFAVGSGGGEPGNPLQAGPTLGSDCDLSSMVRMRSDLIETDPGYALYASNYNHDHGYYKSFSSVVIREDKGNPYDDGGITVYPPLIAEIRIELSSDDAVGLAYEDLNEAGLYVASTYSTPPVNDPGWHYSTTGEEIGVPQTVIKVVTDHDYAIYYIDSYDIHSISGLEDLAIGDYMSVACSLAGDGNEILPLNQALVVDFYNGEAGVRKGYIVVENATAHDYTYEGSGNTALAQFVRKVITPYIMFSRVTFSTLRKTTDRELVFLWKIYF